MGELHRRAGVSTYRALGSDGTQIDPTLGGSAQHFLLRSGVRIAVVDLRNSIAVAQALCPAGRQLSLFLRGGACAISVEDGKPCEVTQGQGLLTASSHSYLTHLQVQPDRDYRFVSIGFDDAWMGDLLGLPTADDDPMLRLLERGARQAFRGTVHLPVEVQRLAQDYFSGRTAGACGTLIAEARALEIVARIAEAFADANGTMAGMAHGPRLSRADADRLHDARALIDREPETAFTLPVLARRVGINVNKLKAGFKHLFGETVGAYATQVRMAHAHHLLKAEGLQVSSVAYRLGYTPAHFAVAFRRRFGVQPSRVAR